MSDTGIEAATDVIRADDAVSESGDFARRIIQAFLMAEGFYVERGTLGLMQTNQLVPHTRLASPWKPSP